MIEQSITAFVLLKINLGQMNIVRHIVPSFSFSIHITDFTFPPNPHLSLK